jgi:hypothetical protein
MWVCPLALAQASAHPSSLQVTMDSSDISHSEFHHGHIHVYTEGMRMGGFSNAESMLC